MTQNNITIPQEKSNSEMLSDKAEVCQSPSLDKLQPLISSPHSDYEKFCQDQADAFFDELGDDRCFGEMAEGQFVRGH